MTTHTRNWDGSFFTSAAAAGAMAYVYARGYLWRDDYDPDTDTVTVTVAYRRGRFATLATIEYAAGSSAYLTCQWSGIDGYRQPSGAVLNRIYDTLSAPLDAHRAEYRRARDARERAAIAREMVAANLPDDCGCGCTPCRCDETFPVCDSPDTEHPGYPCNHYVGEPAPFVCGGCGRPEQVCSASPCGDVILDRLYGDGFPGPVGAGIGVGPVTAGENWYDRDFVEWSAMAENELDALSEDEILELERAWMQDRDDNPPVGSMTLDNLIEHPGYPFGPVGAGIGVGPVTAGQCTHRGIGSGPLPAPEIERYASVWADETFGTAVGRAYLAMPDYDDSEPVRQAYASFAIEVRRQFDALPVDIYVVPVDPYPNYSAMVADVETNRRLMVLDTATTGSHPFLTDHENNMFRAVHDFHGHYMSGRDFSRHGEEAAYQRHARMFSPAARAALTVETRGQNSAFTWVLGGREFPVQKFGLLPEWANRLDAIRPVTDVASELLATPAGHTVSPRVGETLPTAGYWVGIYGESTPADNLAPIRQWLESEYPHVCHAPDIYFGIWTERGRIYVDLVLHVPDLNVALQVAREQEQSAIFDISNGVDIPVTLNLSVGAGVGVGVVNPRVSRKPGDVLPRNFGTHTRTVVARILSWYDAASDGELVAGLEWYDQANRYASALASTYGTSTEYAAAVISHLSPQLGWGDNMRAADEFMATDTAHAVLGESIDRARRIIDHENPLDSFGTRAHKTRSFYRNILLDTRPVTIDRWAVRVAIGSYDTETVRRFSRVGSYAALEHCYRIAADRRGVYPSDMQAVTWVVARNTLG